MKLKFQKHHLEVSSMQEYPRVQCQGSRVCALTRWGTWMIPWKISMILPQWLVEACKPYSQLTKELWNYYTSDNGEVFKVIHSRWQTFKIPLQCKVSQTVVNSKWWCLELAPWAMKWLASVLSKNWTLLTKLSHIFRSTKLQEVMVLRIRVNGLRTYQLTMLMASREISATSSFLLSRVRARTVLINFSFLDSIEFPQQITISYNTIDLDN